MAIANDGYLIEQLDQAGPYSEAHFDTLREDTDQLLQEVARNARFFTDHGPNHAIRVISNLDSILSPKAERIQLNSREAFLLLAAALLHDVGYAMAESLVTEMDNHHVLSAEFITKHHQKIGIRDRHIARLLAKLCLAHRRKVLIPSVFPRPTVQLGVHTIRVSFLAALLSLADAFDCTSLRASEFREMFASAGMPDSSRSYWQRAQQISGVRFNHDEGRIELDANLDPICDETLRMLSQHVINLQDETERALPHLIPDIAFISVVAHYNSSDLDGRMLMRQPHVDAAETMARLIDLMTEYSLRVNQKNDCTLTRHTRFMNTSSEALESRRHIFYSDVPLDSKRPVMTAWDADGPLEINIIERSDAKIEFLLLFRRAVESGETYEYWYRGFAPRCLPDSIEFFTGTDFGLPVAFKLIVPKVYDVKEIWCVEILPSGEHSEILRHLRSKPFKTTKTTKQYSVAVEKKLRGSDCRLYWKWKRP